MTELTYQNAMPLYYRLSGKFSPVGIGLTLLVGCVAAVPLAFAYSYASLYSPVAGWVTFLLTAGFALGIGAITGWMLKSTRTRSKPAAIFTALTTTSVTYFLAWIVFVYAVVMRSNANAPPDDQINITLSELALSPRTLWQFIQAINQAGVYTIKHHTPTGIELVVIWIIEAALIYGISMWMAVSRITQVPFCEACQKWGVVKPLAKTEAGVDAELKAALERHEFSALEKLGPPASTTNFYQVSLQGCADCDTTQTLCIDKTSITFDKKGNAKTSNKKIVNRLTLTPEQVVTVAQTSAAIALGRLVPPERAPADDIASRAPPPPPAV